MEMREKGENKGDKGERKKRMEVRDKGENEGEKGERKENGGKSEKEMEMREW